MENNQISFRERIAKLSPKRLALLAMSLQAKIDALEKDAIAREPIAVIGMGCRFPMGTDSPDSYWHQLCNGEDGITEVPARRWDADAYYDPDFETPGKMSTRYGGFIENMEDFDPHFFNISPREAKSMDPQQRLLLEVAWEALENAAICPDRLNGSPTGVFVGVCGSDYLQMLMSMDASEIDTYSATGNSHSVVSGRLSYLLGLQGPAYSIDTACSSSLVAVHLACKSLLLNECRLALAGGVNLILSPEATITLSKVQMMAPDGRCKTFDAAADGFVRGEGCGMVVLKRLSDAEADGDCILALIRGSAVNQDGRSNGLTAPNGPSQEAVIRQALEDAGVEPAQVGYVECHGTGTALGDPIEVQALAAVLGTGRPPFRPVAIGSVKTNIGHLEAAAGIAGFIKAVLCLQNREIPRQLHFNQPSPHIAWEAMPVEVVRNHMDWDCEDGRRIAGVSSFGFSGTNVHVVLEEACVPKTVAPDRERPLHLLCLSARGEGTLRILAEKYRKFLARQGSMSSSTIGDICHSANAGRAVFADRLYLLGKDGEDLDQKLLAFTENKGGRAMGYRKSTSKEPTRVAFLFTGQGSQYVQMGKALYEAQPVFRETLDQCHEIVSPYLEKPLLSVLFPAPGEPSPLDQTAFAQPALFSIGYALYKLWQSWGIHPSAAMGHSVGEYVAACMAGIFRLEDGLQLIAARGRLIQSLPAAGGMAAIMSDRDHVQSVMAPYGNRLSIAALNGPRNTVISGDQEALKEVLVQLKATGVAAKPLQVSHAFHSALLDPILAPLEEEAGKYHYAAPNIDLVLNLTGELADTGDITPQYWRRHAREPVRFQEGIHALHEMDYRLYLEVGPHPVLMGMGRQCLPDRGNVWLPSLHRQKNDWDQILDSLGQLYIHSVCPDWIGFDRPYPRRRRALPTYPFNRQKYWMIKRERHEGQIFPVWPAATHGGLDHPLLRRKYDTAKGEFVFDGEAALSVLPYLKHHRIFGQIIMPAPVYAEMALSAAQAALDVNINQIKDFVVHEALLLDSDEDARRIQIILKSFEGGGFSFSIFSAKADSASPPLSWILHASGRMASVRFQAEDLNLSIASWKQKLRKGAEASAYYDDLEALGIKFGNSFQGIQKLWRGTAEAVSRIALPSQLRSESKRYVFHPVVLDAGFQTLGACMPSGKDHPAYLMVGIDHLDLHGSLHDAAWSFADIQTGGQLGDEMLTGELYLLDDEDRLVAAVTGMRLKRAKREALLRPAIRDFTDCLYELNWIPCDLEEPTLSVGPCDFFSSPGAIADPVHVAVDGWYERYRINQYLQLLGGLEELSLAYILAAFRDLGWHFEPGARFTTMEIMAEFKIADRYQRLTRRLLGILVEENMLSRVEEDWEALRDFPELDSRTILAELQQQHSLFEGEMLLTDRCANRLADVLRGHQDPLQLLFPEGSMGDVEKLTESSPVARAYNEMVGEAVALALKNLPQGRPIRILEIGAGTGGTTSSILHRIAAIDLNYIFTDISQLFLSKAQQKFSTYPFIRYKYLDIEKDPTEAGFEPNGFDIVIAANVLHATMNLHQSLANVRKLLAPGGLMILLEGTQAQRWVDLTFGLTDGWWKFTDHDLRPAHPLLSADQWRDLVGEVGFLDVEVLPRTAPGDTQLPSQALILAQNAYLPLDRVDMSDRQAFWVIFSDKKTVGKQLLDRVEANGASGLLVEPRDAFATQDAGCWSLDPTRPQDYRQLFERVADDLDGTLCKIVHLWSLGASLVEEPALASLTSANRRVCQSVLYLTQAAVRANWQQVPEIWLVTEGAQPVGAGDSDLTLEQSALWGLGRTIGVEHPEVWGGLIDLEIGEDTDRVGQLWNQIQQPHGEDQVAFRGGRRFAARLMRCKTLVRTKGSPSFAADGSYLITGGTGGMGLQVAQWMASQGACHLTLMSRRGASRDGQKMIDGLASRGINVVAISADVSQEDDVQRVLGDIKDQMPPLRGIVHLAGIFDDRVLSRQDWERFERVFAPKISGGWLLHTLTQSIPLDFFVIFSSAASFLAPVGLSNYAAANAFLDTLAHYRRRRGLPALCINWGPWDKTGMAGAVGQRRENQWFQAGFDTMTPERGLEALGELMQGRQVQAAVLNADWPKYLNRFGDNNIPSLYNGLLKKSPIDRIHPEGKKEAAPFLKRIEEAHPSERVELIQMEIHSLVATVLDLDRSFKLEPHVGFFDLGMDSLTAVELKNRLQAVSGQTLSSTVVFDHPTVETLTVHLSEALAEVMEERMIADVPPDPIRQTETAGVDEELSEDQLASLLADKLKEID